MRVSDLTFATLALCSLAHAQRVWIVDARRTIGYDYAEVQPAVDMAKVGDTIRILPGSYANTFTVDKGLRIIAEDNVFIESWPFNPITAKNLKAGETLVLKGFQPVKRICCLPHVVVTNCAGSVHLEDLRFGSAGEQNPVLEISNCAAVTLQSCTVDGGVQITSSTVTACTTTFARPSFAFARLTSAAVNATDSDLTLVQCTATGQRLVPSLGTPTPAVDATRSTVRVVGDVASRFSVDANGGGNGSAIRGDALSNLAVDPRVRVIPLGSSNAIAGFARIVTQRMSFVTVTGGALGATLDVSAHGPQGHFFALFYGAPSLPLATSSFGTLWLDARLLQLAGAGTFDSSTVFRRSFKIPRQPALLGLPLAWQVIAGASPRLELGNVAVVAIGP